MKKLLILLAAIFFFACSVEGQQGKTGMTGLNGMNRIDSVMMIEPVMPTTFVEPIKPDHSMENILFMCLILLAIEPITTPLIVRLITKRNPTP